MIAMLLAAPALTAANPPAQGTPVESNLEFAATIAGDWTYSSTADGSEATFANASAQPQLTMRCTRSNRRITIFKNTPSASPTLWVWTSSQSKSLPATFDAASGRVSVELGAYDPFLDAIAASRGRIGFSTSGLDALVIPPWADVGRVIEDCRV